MKRAVEYSLCLCVALVVWLSAHHAIAGTITFVITALPADTPADATFTLGASTGGWDPGHADYAFSKDIDGRRTLVLDVEDGTTLHYKVTRGSWDSVERDAQGRDIANRQLEVRGNTTVELAVARWANSEPIVRPSTITGRVETIKDVESPQLGNSRDLLVYLPPSYAAGDKRYPVLYMHDGQNLFDEATSLFGEWGADEAAQALAARGREVIIVGIPNNAERISEYGPFPDEEHKSKGRGAAYADFLVKTVKPLVDERYHTIADRKHTGIAGSSMGGLISLYAALAHPDTFGFAGVLSPALFVGEGKIFDWVEAHPIPDVRIYLDMGTREGMLTKRTEASEQDFVGDTMRMANLLVKQGNEVKLFIVRDAVHNEAAWRERFPDVLEWFLSNADSM